MVLPAARWLQDQHVAAVSFTGWQSVGALAPRPLQCRTRRACSWRWADKNPLVVLDDCDLDRAVQCALDGAFFATGQRCTASSRIIVTQGVHDGSSPRSRRTCESAQGGRCAGPQTPRWAPWRAMRGSRPRFPICISPYEARRPQRHGGERLSLATPGYYVSPALIVDTRPTCA